MAYTLVGSTTSPYVRRLRLYMTDTPYQFEPMRLLDSAADDQRVSALNPLKRVPVLLIDGQPLWETRIIYQYLHRQRGLAPLSLAEDNGLSAIDTLQDQLIQRFLLGRFEHPLLTNNAYFRRGAERQRLTLAFLNEQVRSGVYRRWDYPAMSLYTLLDWSLFRQSLQLVELGDDLMEFLAANRHQRLVAETDPRLA